MDPEMTGLSFCWNRIMSDSTVPSWRSGSSDPDLPPPLPCLEKPRLRPSAFHGRRDRLAVSCLHASGRLLVLGLSDSAAFMGLAPPVLHAKESLEETWEGLSRNAGSRVADDQSGACRAGNIHEGTQRRREAGRVSMGPRNPWLQSNPRVRPPVSLLLSRLNMSVAFIAPSQVVGRLMRAGRS